MNKKIKELAEEIGFDLYNEDKENMIQEFAELILNEVLIIADNFELEVNRSGLVDSIKHHFKVE